MPREIFFQCSLPRVGSTLLQNILNQDDRIYASANNGLLGMATAAKISLDNSIEFKHYDKYLLESALKNFTRKGFLGFYNGLTSKEYAIDKSRGNFANYSMVSSFYPNPKIICMVRAMPDIFCSLEKMYRANQHKSNPIQNYINYRGTTTAKRVAIWHDSFTYMMNSFYQNIVSGNDKKILFIKYESFCIDPELEMKRLYDFLNIPTHSHDFKNIPQTVKENEEVYEYTGLLKIRPELQMIRSNSELVLGKDIVKWINEEYKIYNSYFHFNS